MIPFFQLKKEVILICTASFCGWVIGTMFIWGVRNLEVLVVLFFIWSSSDLLLVIWFLSSSSDVYLVLSSSNLSFFDPFFDCLF